MISLARTSDPFWIVDSGFGGPLLWLGVLAALAVAVVSVKLSARSPRRRRIGVLLSTLPVLVLVGEGTVRVYHRATHGISLLVPMRVFLDRDLGWEGIQSFGNPDTDRRKIFVVGDSFTTPMGLDATAMYYRVLDRVLDAEIFAYGGGGYGTLQEYLVLDRYLLSVRPDLIVLQVHSNDFINNQWELERASYFNNNLAVRPYLIGDAIHYRFPEFLGTGRLFLAAHSRLFYWIVERFELAGANLAQNGVLHSIEEDIEVEGIALPAFRDAVQTTERLVALFKQRSAGVPIVAFAVDDAGILTAQWRRIFQRQSIPFTEDVVTRIHQQEMGGTALRLADRSHWNAAGHAICGATLAEWLLQHLTTPAPRPGR